MSRSTCKYCGAAIRWATTEAGKPMPLDPSPNPRGNQELSRDGERVKAAHPVYTPDHLRYMPHWKSCPHADRARRR